MSVIKTKQELDNVINELRANEVSNKFSELRTNKESNNYDWLRSYTAGEDLIKNAVAKYNLQKYRKLSSSGSFEFSELAEQAAATKKEELAIVQRGEFEYNYIDTNGKLLSNEWFKSASYFYNGFAVVQRGYNQYNFIDRQGKLLSDEWFKDVDYFNKDGLARVQRKDSKWNFINTDGKIISEQWFKSVEDFQ